MGQLTSYLQQFIPTSRIAGGKHLALGLAALPDACLGDLDRVSAKPGIDAVQGEHEYLFFVLIRWGKDRKLPLRFGRKA